MKKRFYFCALPSLVLGSALYLYLYLYLAPQPAQAVADQVAVAEVAEAEENYTVKAAIKQFQTTYGAAGFTRADVDFYFNEKRDDTVIIAASENGGFFSSGGKSREELMAAGDDGNIGYTITDEGEEVSLHNLLSEDAATVGEVRAALYALAKD